MIISRMHVEFTMCMIALANRLTVRWCSLLPLLPFLAGDRYFCISHDVSNKKHACLKFLAHQLQLTPELLPPSPPPPHMTTVWVMEFTFRLEIPKCLITNFSSVFFLVENSNRVKFSTHYSNNQFIWGVGSAHIKFTINMVTLHLLNLFSLSFQEDCWSFQWSYS